MNISPVRTAQSQSGTTTGSQLNMDTFLTLLTVQLATQNPLEPMNDRDFFAQLAQLGQVQGTEQMTRQMNSLSQMLLEGFGALGLSVQDLGMLQASNMVGKEVSSTRTLEGQREPQEFSGTVEKVSFKNGEIVLSVRDSQRGDLVEVKMDKLKSVGQ